MAATGRDALAQSATADREIVISRVINAPRELVFEAFTEVRHLSRWWGPEGFTTTTRAFEFRVGGEWIFVFHGPDGTDYPNRSVFIEIIEPERIVYDHVVPPHFRMTMTLAADGDGTLLTWRMRFESAEVCDKLKPICVPANEQNFDRLEKHLSAA